MGYDFGKFSGNETHKLSLSVPSNFFYMLCLKGTRGAILTTHSMEEADALCSKVGIMVKGELRYDGIYERVEIRVKFYDLR